ncbi:hypothetical protein GGF46_001159 [Coemansia sp. RSA 552]|nr:hypothetical protein GGF46_001159 [Coemansia sp. RSA 552]
MARVRTFIFLCVVAAVALLASYMFASYIDTAAAYAHYRELGFGHVFVLSEPPYAARRRNMARILQQQGIFFGFFRATAAFDIDHREAYSFWLGEEHWPPVPANHTAPAALLASFRTHMNAINDVIRLELPSALILADSVDISLDAKQRMHSIAKALPASWDVLFLGHCSPAPAQRPSALHPDLYVAADPQCAVAYAISNACAVRLKRVLDHMWPHPSQSFEQVLAGMVAPMILEAYVVSPPLVAPANKSQALYTLRYPTLDNIGLID